MAEGLRERKKRQTRQHISDVATELFLERGFDAVTVAEVAEAAEVSVNTVYNYFPAKEDLFLDRGKDNVERLSGWVRGRAPGESAAEAVLRELRAEAEAISPRVGLFVGWEKFMVVVNGAESLRSRIWRMRQEELEDTIATMHAESGAAEGDQLPYLVAGQLSWLHSTLLDMIRREMIAGRDPAVVSREALELLDLMEELLGETVLNYARKGAG